MKPPREIIFVSQQVPWPLDTGGNIRSFYMLEALASRFPVTLIASVRSPDLEAEALQALGDFCHQIILVPDRKSTTVLAGIGTVSKGLFNRRSLFIQHNYNLQIAAAVRERARTTSKPVVHLNHLDTMPYLKLSDSISVLDTHNILHEYYQRRSESEPSIFKRLLMKLESRQLRSFESRSFDRVDRLLVCSAEEQKAVARLDPKLQAIVLPNGVDCTLNTPSFESPFSNPPQLLFVGDMGYPPNQDAVNHFIQRVLPGVQAKVPEVRLTVVGRNPPTELVELAERQPNIDVTGYVEDVRTYYREARIFVVPIHYGSGTRLKILEAFAMGLPTVSTSIGAEGIAARNGEEIMIADEPASMVDAILSLLASEDLYESMRHKARSKVLEAYDWKIIGESLQAVYEDLLEQEGSSLSDHSGPST